MKNNFEDVALIALHAILSRTDTTLSLDPSCDGDEEWAVKKAINIATLFEIKIRKYHEEEK